MKFKLRATCMNCQSTNVEVEIWMAQGSGCVGFKCRECGAEEAYFDQGPEDIQDAFDIGRSEPHVKQTK